jgi:prophage antirepressor-like protein
MQFQIFKYQEDEDHLDNLTTVEINNEVWFVASDVCKLLGLTNPTESLKALEDDEKLTSEILRAGQNRKVNLISESGLYALIFRSTKPSAKQFRKWITKEVIPAIRKTGSFGINRLETPNFVIRYNDNWDRTDKGHFSVISELFIRLYGRFERVGYQIPNKAFNGKEIRPDTSVGIMFSAYLKKNHPEMANMYKMYMHKFQSGLELEARQYQNELLPIFIYFIDNHWMPENAQKYFKERDPLALDYLPKLLGSGD